MNGTAVQIVRFKRNRVILDEHALGKILDKVGPRPVAIVSINGPMRTGKSYIIGHFMRYLSSAENEDWIHKTLTTEFHWKNSAERQTTGILVWSEPFIVKCQGRQVATLLMDTQGGFDDKTTTNENACIFALSCLLSSVLIYNIKNQLSEDMLQFLQLFIGYAKLPVDDDDGTFSKLIFLIRDWLSPVDYEFGYYDDNTSKWGKNFKRDKINVQCDMPPEVKVVHQEIISSFETVAGCLMPYPGNNLAYYDKIHDLEPMFINSIKEFVPKVFQGSNVTTKKIGGHEMTGVEFKKIIVKWAELFRKYEIPPAQSVVESTAVAQNQVAYSIAIKYYENELKSVKHSGGLSNENLEKLHRTHSKESIDIFNRAGRIKNDEIKATYLKKLTEDIQKFYSSCQEINCIVNEFQNYKVESAKEKQQMKDDMDSKIRDIESKQKQERRRSFCNIL